MLRPFVELKAAHPERVLLYRLGDCFKCICKEGGKAIDRRRQPQLWHRSRPPRLCWINWRPEQP